MFSDDQITSIRQAANLLDIVIGRGVKLTPSGASHKGLCPFHREKTPSFHVYPDKQFFKCYGCGATGDVFAFVMDSENLPFPEAVRLLADRHGITLNEQPGARPSGEPDRRRLAEATAFASQLFQRVLHAAPEGADGRDYLKSRGITGDLAKAWGIGYAPAEWDYLLQRALKAGFTIGELDQANLAYPERDGKSARDRFHGRVMFPIRNTRDQVAGFGGRAIRADDPAKYLNTSETPLFQKSKLLYGLHQVNEARRRNPDLRQEPIYVCEGYLDVIAMHSAGLATAVAPLGTALTADHVRLLRPNGLPVVMVFDGDDAGVEATRKAIVQCVAAGVEARVARLDVGRDPYDILEQDGADGLRATVTETRSAYDFVLALSRAKYGDSAEGRAEIVREMARVFGESDDRVAEQVYIEKVAFDLAVGRAAVDAEWSRATRRARPAEEAPRRLSVRPRSSREERAEHDLLLALLGDPSLIDEARERVEVEGIGDPTTRKIVAVLLSLDGEPDTGRLLARLRSLEEEAAVDYVTRLTADLIERQALLGEGPKPRGIEPFRDLLLGYCSFRDAEAGRLARERRIREMREALAAQDSEAVARSVAAIADLDRERHLDQKNRGKAAEAAPEGPPPR